MTAVVKGYTVEIQNSNGEAALYTASFPGPGDGVATSTYETFLWSQLDAIVSFYDTNAPSLAPHHIALVQRHEEEDTYLTHP